MEHVLITGAVDAYGQFTADWWSTPPADCAVPSGYGEPGEWRAAALG